MSKFLTISDAEAATRQTFGVVTQDGDDVLVTPSTGGAGTGTVTSVTGTLPIVITGVPSVTPNVTLAPGSTTMLVFANVAALEAYNVATNATPVGALASVQSNGSLWAFSNEDTLTVDGITVASSAGSGLGRWQRMASETQVFYQKQASWFIDPAAGNDEAAGTIGAPIKTKAELYRRWGYTWSPTFDGTDVTITYVSNEAAGNHDPGLFAPNFLNGASLTHTANLPAAGFTGTLLAVTPKNRAANQPLESTFTTATGALAIGMMLVNATRGNSVAWVVEGGPTFVLSQPCAPYAAGTDATAVTEVDTWANGDAISGFALVQVDLAVMGGKTAAFAAASAPQHIATRIQVVDLSATESPLEIDGAGNVACIEAFIARAPSVRSTWAFTTFANAVIAFPVSATSQVPLNLSFRAGVIGSGGVSAEGAGCLVDDDVVIGGAIQGEGITAGHAFLDTGARFLPLGGLAAVTMLYGQGALDAIGTFEYAAPATTSLPLTGGLRIGGSANAYSSHTPGGVGTATSTALVAITAAALDAAAGVAGFGGLAYIPGVGAITSGAVTP